MAVHSDPGFPSRAEASEAIFAGLNLPSLGLKVTEHVATELATHIVLAR